MTSMPAWVARVPDPRITLGQDIRRGSGTRATGTRSAPQLGGDLKGGLAGLFHRAGLEADRTYTRVPSASVALADRGQVVVHGLARPGVRSHRNLGPEAGGAH